MLPEISQTELIILGGVIGTLVASIIYIIVCLLLKRCKIKLGTLRPQVMVVLLALFLITMWSLHDPGTHNIATLAVGGLIALATRIIERDSGKGKDDE